MRNKEQALRELIDLSRALAEPKQDYVILGEGNTAVRHAERSFLVKCSGVPLAGITAEGFVEIIFDRALSLLDRPGITDDELRSALGAARLDGVGNRLPSIETLVHAVLLKIDGVRFVGHTHPTAINMLTCSRVFWEAYAGRLFPDEIVVCGPAPLLIAYRDPGLPLALEIRTQVQAHLQKYGERPRIILVENHGFFALGATAKQVLDLTEMAVKTARILLGAYTAGGPQFLSDEAVKRIHTRPDELARRKLLGATT